MKFLDIYDRLKDDLLYIERELEKNIRTEHAILSETSLHLLKAGGKRLRPVFVLLAGEFGGYPLERLKIIACALEMIHMASLVHDDVIDDADTRRGQLTVKSKWDNRIAMYTGDYIFAKALSVAAELNDPDVHQTLSKAIVQMSIGEIEQIRLFFNTAQTVRDYLLRIRRKTALLIAISCQLGAIAADVPKPLTQKLYNYGYNVGMAFQIRDDILDICGTEAELGKPPGSDIRQGNITLPVIFSLEDDALKPRLLREIEHIREQEGNADVSRFLHMIRPHHGLKRAEQLAARFIDKAVSALNGLPDIAAKKNLADIAYFVGNRTF
jgi:heptaprenyl diphosphate synthase